MVRLLDQDEAAGDGEFSRSAAQSSAFDRAWLAAGEWPPEVVSTRQSSPDPTGSADFSRLLLVPACGGRIRCQGIWLTAPSAPRLQVRHLG